MHNDSRERTQPAESARPANSFISTLLGFLMFVLVCVFILLLAIRTVDTARLIQNTDIAGVLQEEGMSNLIVDQINRLPFVETVVDINDVDEFIRNETVSQEIGRVLENYLEAFAEGDLDHHITQNEVMYIVRSLEPELSDMLNFEMTDADYEYLSSVLDAVLDFSEFSIGNIADQTNVNLAIPQIAISGNLIIIVGILCVAILLLMVLHHRRSPSDVFKSAGVPIMFSGVMCFLLGFIVRSSTHMLGVVFHRISVLLSGTVSSVLTFSLYAAGLGAAFVVIHIILRATRARQVI